VADVLALPDPEDDDEGQNEDEEIKLGQNPSNPTPAHRRNEVQTLELGSEMWQEYMQGLTFKAISELHGIPYHQVSTLLHRFARVYGKKQIERVRRMDLDRIEALLDAQWERAVKTGNKDHVKLVLVMIQLRARILGYEAPRRIEHGGEVKAGITPELADLLKDRRQQNEVVRGELARVSAEVVEEEETLDAEVVDDDDHHDD